MNTSARLTSCSQQTVNVNLYHVTNVSLYLSFIIYYLYQFFSIRTFLHCFYPLIFILRNSQLEFDVNLQFAVSMIL